MLELVGDFFGRKKECVVAGISGGGTGGPRGRGRAQGVGRAPNPRGQVLAPPVCSQCQISSNIPEKNHIKFAGHLENFYFWDILYCMDNSENRQKILFLLYLS